MSQRKDKEEELEKALRRLQVPFSSADTARARAQVLLRTVENKTNPSSAAKPRTVWLRAAAVWVLLLGAVAALHFFSAVHLHNSGRVVAVHMLPDGSRLTLAPRASVHFNKASWIIHRELFLKGEASFDVVEGSTFTVRAPLGEVEVKGTSFSVWANDHQFLVHCLSGKVEARIADHAIMLGPGALVKADLEKSIWNRMQLDVRVPILPQATPELSFEDTPIDLVCAEMEKAFGLKVINQLDPALRYTGRLNRDRKDESFRVLCATFGARMVVSEGTVTLSP